LGSDLLFGESYLARFHLRAYSLVGAGAGLGWLVLVFLEENTIGWLIWAG